MGTDVYEQQKPCPCGNGEVQLSTSSPDHHWPSVYNVHHLVTILCPVCAQEYVVEGTNIFRRADRNHHAEASRRLGETEDRFMKSAAVRDLLAKFGAHLDAMKSVAAIHRYLQSHHMTTSAIGSFRKYWKGGQAWAQEIGKHHLLAVVRLLGEAEEPFQAGLKEIERLRAEVPQMRVVMKVL